MAFCGSEFADEKKEEDIHSLDKICVYSTSKKQRSLPRKKEGLFKKDGDGRIIDRRTKIIYSSKKFSLFSYHAQGQFTAKLPDGTKTVGSCNSISVKKRPGTTYALTCAHNVGDWSVPKKCFVHFNELLMYQARQGVNTWSKCISLEEKTDLVHPNYNGQADSGFDIALCRKMKTISVKRNTSRFRTSLKSDVYFYHAEPENLAKGMKVEIAGYPGEENGQPYTHTGTIVHIIKRPLGGYVLYYNVDCTGGNSGSPIMIIDKEWIKKFNKKHETNVDKVIIGIHTGQDPLERLNFGTLLTPSIYKWMSTGEVDQVRQLD